MQANQAKRVLATTDLREIDVWLIEMLTEQPVTPSYARKRIIKDQNTEFTSGYVQERLAHLADHGHAVNQLNSGLYKLTDDPRTEDDH